MDHVVITETRVFGLQEEYISSFGGYYRTTFTGDRDGNNNPNNNPYYYAYATRIDMYPRRVVVRQLRRDWANDV